MLVKDYGYLLDKPSGFREYNEESNLSIKDIESFEKDTSVKLSDDYKIFIKTYNGFTLNYNFDNSLIKLIESKNICLDQFFSLGFTKYKMLIPKDDFEYYYSKRMYELQIFPFMSNSTGYSEGYIGFGTENFGKIYTSSIDTIGGDGEELIHICNIFTEFMDNFIKVRDEF